MDTENKLFNNTMEAIIGYSTIYRKKGWPYLKDAVKELKEINNSMDAKTTMLLHESLVLVLNFVKHDKIAEWFNCFHDENANDEHKRLWLLIKHGVLGIQSCLNPKVLKKILEGLKKVEGGSNIEKEETIYNEVLAFIVFCSKTIRSEGLLAFEKIVKELDKPDTFGEYKHFKNRNDKLSRIAMALLREGLLMASEGIETKLIMEFAYLFYETNMREHKQLYRFIKLGILGIATGQNPNDIKVNLIEFMFKLKKATIWK